MVDFVDVSPIFKNPFEGTQPVLFSGQDAFPIPIFVNSDDFFGDLTDNRPVDVEGSLQVGQVCPGFVEDFYNRVHVTPNVLELGNLVSAQVRTFEVWNAFFASNNNISLIAQGDTSGIILTEPAIPPTLYAALEAKEYSLDIGLTGPPTIDVVYTWLFDTESRTLILTGQRVIIWAFSPDWSDAVVERYEFLTQIIEADDGSENRNRLRTHPRRSLEYRILIDSARLFAVPIWTDCARTTTLTPIGDFVIDIDTTDFTSFKVGGIAIFFIDQRTTEAVEIASIGATTLVLARATLQAWPIGSRIYPALAGRMVEDQSLTQPTADIDLLSIKFDFVDNEIIPAVDSPTAYRDDFVLEKTPNRVTDLSLLYQSKYGLVDFGIDVPFVDDRSGYPDVVTSFEFVEESREQIWFWKEWMHSRAGKHTRFYFASQSKDFIPLKGIDSTDGSITVQDYEYRNFYNFALGKRDIVIFAHTGEIFYRRITSAVSTTPGEELLGIDAPTGFTITLANLKLISFLHPCRVDADSMEFAWDSTEISHVSFPTRVLAE